MPEIERPQPIFQFGVFELNGRTGELRKHGVKLKLQEQPAQILALLLEHPGDVVTREEIRKRLWPEQTYVDFDNAINSAVRKLRDALADSSENPRFVETLPRRGYRFIAPVSGGSPASQKESPVAAPDMISAEMGQNVPTQPATAPSQPYRPGRLALTSVVVFLVLVGLTAGWRLRLGPKEATLPISISPLSSSAGMESFPSFSPDGTQIAYTWNGPGQDNWDIYVKLIGGGEPLRLTSAPAIDISPAWSPDGRLIAFVRPLSEQRSAVITVPALGGMETRLTETPNFDLHTIRPLAPPRLLAWSPDAKRLVIAESDVPGGGTGLVEYSISTQVRRRLTEAPRQYGDVEPAVSPNGRMLAFTRRDTVDVSDLYVLALTDDFRADGAPKRITFDHQRAGQPAWSSDGRMLIFASNRGGTSGLWRVPVEAAGSPEPVPFAGDGVASPTVSKQGQRLAYTRSISDSNIWQLNVPAAMQSAAPPVKLIASAAADDFPQISRDGKVAFCSSRSGSREIWVATSDGSHQFQLTKFGRHSSTPRWSPDGTEIAFDSNVSGVFQIYVVSAEGGRPRLVTPGPSENIIPSWSHDGQWIYFCSARTGRREVWKITANGDNPQQLTKNGGCPAYESADGKTLYYNVAGKLWRAPVVGGGNEEQIPGASAMGRSFDVSRTGIYFLRPGKFGPTINVYRFDTGKPETIFAPHNTLSMGLAVSSDDKRILYSQVDYAGTNIMIVDHYR